MRTGRRQRTVRSRAYYRETTQFFMSPISSVIWNPPGPCGNHFYAAESRESPLIRGPVRPSHWATSTFALHSNGPPICAIALATSAGYNAALPQIWPCGTKNQLKVCPVANGTFAGVDEAKLWSMADALRNNMDPAEYKHVVLGLIFLKYISDAFRKASSL